MWSVSLGGGRGIGKGIGAPRGRGFLAVAFTPDFRDRDHDGVYDVDDRCPDQPEDRDGFQDNDGCPDPDNDNDGIPDAQDKCPNDAEDLDQFEDEDGCPEPDNDKDGIPDINDACPNAAEDGRGKRPKDGCPSTSEDSDGDGVNDTVDKCPDEPEDRDGFQDEDGCPDPDNDNDGIPDNFDNCPNEAEDTDGFEDEDGCPDPDNDKDGIPDAQDKCPNEPETLNGIKDEDGCPDAGAPLVHLDQGSDRGRRNGSGSSMKGAGRAARQRGQYAGSGGAGAEGSPRDQESSHRGPLRGYIQGGDAASRRHRPGCAGEEGHRCRAADAAGGRHRHRRARRLRDRAGRAGGGQGWPEAGRRPRRDRAGGPMRIVGWGASDVGRKRHHNEDSFLCNDRLGLYAVADGMGGHLGGERASRMAVEIVERELEQALRAGPYPAAGAKPALLDDDPAPVSSLLRRAVVEADRNIYEAALANPALSGMGTTLTVLLFSGGQLHLGHVGDSRAYLYRDGKARQLTEDHSWIQEQVRAGLLSPEEAKESRFRNIITRSVGFEPSVEPDLVGLPVQAGDCYVLCSDGLSNYLSVEEVGQVLTGHFYRDVAKVFVDMANERGGDDNVTCLVVYAGNEAKRRWDPLAPTRLSAPSLPAPAGNSPNRYHALLRCARARRSGASSACRRRPSAD